MATTSQLVAEDDMATDGQLHGDDHGGSHGWGCRHHHRTREEDRSHGSAATTTRRDTRAGRSAPARAAAMSGAAAGTVGRALRQRPSKRQPGMETHTGRADRAHYASWLESMWKDRAPLGWDESDRPDRAGGLRAAQRLLPGDHRRDRARRRRLPRDGCLIASVASPA